MEEAGKKNKSKPTKNKPHVQDAHQRLNFLHQIALQISSESTSTSDGYAKLSRAIGKHVRGVLDTESVKIEPDLIRSFCKKCKQVLVAKSKRFDLIMLQKKVIQRKCLNCGDVKNLELKKDYLSRNELFRKTTGSYC